MSISDEGYSKKVSCTLNSISMFYMQKYIYFMNKTVMHVFSTLLENTSTVKPFERPVSFVKPH
jgi:hypothetical protein